MITQVEGFDDFTLASPWERFIKDVEEVCRQWQAAGAAVLQARGSEQVEDLPALHVVRHEQPYGMTSYSIAYYFPVAHASTGGMTSPVPDDDSKQRAGGVPASDQGNQRSGDGNRLTQRPPPEGPNVAEVIEDTVDEWGTDLHYLQLWFGVREFLVVVPMNANECATDMHEAMMLLSSMAIALSNCDCGSCLWVTTFACDTAFYSWDVTLQYDFSLGNSGGINPAISLSMRAAYKLKLMGCSSDGESLLSMDDEFAYSAEWEQDGQWDFDCPWAYWHPMDDPIKGLELTVIWRNLQANSPADLAAMERLPAQSADDWILRVVLYKDTLDAELDEEPLGFARQLRGTVYSMYQAEGVQFMEDFVSGNTADLRGLLGGTAASLAVPPPSVVGRVIRDLFDEEGKAGTFSSLPGSNTQHPYQLVAKTAPPESLFSRFCLHALRFSNIRAIAVLWLDFVRELRFYWEEGVQLPRLPSTGPPDLGCCLLHQKLQMLALCITRKIAEEAQQSSRNTESVDAVLDDRTQVQSHGYQGSHSQGLKEEVDNDLITRLGDRRAVTGRRPADGWHDSMVGGVTIKGRSSSNGGRTGLPGEVESKTKDGGGGAGIDGEGWEVDFNDLEELIEEEERKNGPRRAVGKSKEDSDSSSTKYESCSDAESQSEENSGVVIRSAIQRKGNSTAISRSPNSTSISRSPSSRGSSRSGSPPRLRTGSIVEARQRVGGLGKNEWKRRGALRPAGDLKLRNFPVQMYVPITQDPLHMTEDMLMEREQALAALRDSEMGRDARARLECDVLASDMSAFKAANPGAALEDFIRWHSPRDWVEDDGQCDQSSRSPDDVAGTSGRGQPTAKPNSKALAIRSAKEDVRRKKSGKVHERGRVKEAAAEGDANPTSRLTMSGKSQSKVGGNAQQQQRRAPSSGRVKGRLSKRMQDKNNIWHQLWRKAEPIPACEQKPLFDYRREAEKSAGEARKTLTELCTAFEHVEDGIVTGVSLARKFKKIPRIFHALMRRYCEGPGSICVNVRGGVPGSAGFSKGGGKVGGGGSKGGAPAVETERDIVTQLFTAKGGEGQGPARKIKRKKWGNEWCANLLEGLPPSAREITLWGGALDGGVLEGGDLEGVAPAVGRDAMDGGLGDGIGVCDRMYARLTPKDLRIALALVSRE
ncbi:hypothetical protein CBR_g32390 [Chara braunii]|uniref:Rab3 GTPase-activating protein catalytic subunit n=1 Tax=Chara braunii TaxID=69332 RepID=A0A388JYB3_CHABU|nr:hypothetical protein CBR_g32390 [Chara braunii]|eukprot:GBG62804.1 hypothetical protein CBR_g32390 [Chara braunii]